LKLLRDLLQDWTLKGGEFSWRVYRNWIASERNPQELPWPGGRLAQPRWLDDDLTMLDMVRRFWELNGSLPDTTSLPRLDQL
jgi:hypothetical protein